MAPSRESTSFTWDSCDDLDDRRRIKIKEEALQLGIEQCKQLISRFETSFFTDKESNHELYSNVLGHKIIQGWIDSCKDLIKRHDALQVPVGVAGPTGSGKTSALNALLDYRELLPTDNAAAATAVPCKVAYNDDKRPSYRFRALVTFREHSNLVRQLDQFFEDLGSKSQLLNKDSDSDNLENDDYDALRVLDSAMKPALELIRTIFGLEENELKSLNTEKLLGLNEGVRAILGTTKSLHSSKVDVFSDMIRPYMNSSSADHGGDGSEFPAWPLIDEVEIYVKSDILLNGVVLVDLPGLADSVESRAAVAERYFPKLAATLIVAPASRAADDPTSVNLISSHQELRMKLDGKFHKRAYCVVLSQIDQIDRESDFKKKWTKSSKELQSLLTQEKDLKDQRKVKSTEKSEASKKLSKLITEEKAALKKMKKLSTPANGVNKGEISLRGVKGAHTKAKARRVEAKETNVKLQDELHRLDEKVRKVKGNITFLCVKERNRFLAERIQQDFERRQSRISSNGHDDLEKTYDGKISDREAHADSLLHELQSLYYVIQTWSKDEWSQSPLSIDRAWVETEVMPSIYEQMKERLNKYWVDLDKSVQKKNPLRDNTQHLEKCVNRCKDAVKGWSYKDGSSNVKQHWLTYQASIIRNGGKFVSKSGETRIEYYWMEQLSDVLMETVVEDWNLSLNHDIPKLGNSAIKIVENIWNDFSKRLRIGIEQALPELTKYLDAVLPKFDIIKDRIKDQVQQALSSIPRDASHIHPNMLESIQKKWGPTFGKARQEKGTGSYDRRKKHISDFASKSSEKMCIVAFASLRDRLSQTFSTFPKKLDKISISVVKEVEAHINALLDNIARPEVKAEDALERKAALQKYVRSVLIKWDLEWRVPVAVHDEKDIEIPDEYHEIDDDDAVLL
ncbi:hypothetical protein ABKA04_006016 [Annulohypoxylon sp. FPYF3050]